MNKFTTNQFNIIGHTLGIDPYHCLISKKKSDKILPDEFYRNYYNYGSSKIINSDPKWITELNDYIDKWERHGLLFFGVNEKGIKLFRKQFKEEITDTYIPLSRSKQRYQDFLDLDDGQSFAEFIGVKRKPKNYL